MLKKNATDALNDVISLLEIKRSDEFILLKEQFHITYESLKPINLIKSTFHEVAESSELKSNVVNNVIGFATGYFTKKVLVGASRNPVKNLFGTLFQFAVTNVISKNSDGIKSLAQNMLHCILKYRKDAKQHYHNNGN
jgi:hypothetical protein